MKMKMDDLKLMSDKQIMDLFFYRPEPFAIKTKAGFYVPVNRSVTLQDIKKHREGKHVIGAYNSRSDATCQYACIDFDNFDYREVAEEIASSNNGLIPVMLGVKTEKLFETSESKGFHVWFFFESPVPTEVAYNYLMWIMIDHELKVGRNAQIDIYPKSPKLTGKRVSWMVRLPKFS